MKKAPTIPATKIRNLMPNNLNNKKIIVRLTVSINAIQKRIELLDDWLRTDTYWCLSSNLTTNKTQHTRYATEHEDPYYSGL